MSVNTTSDDLKQKAKEHISAAIKCLIEFCDEDTYGYNDYTEEYINNVFECLGELLKIKKKL